MWIPVMVVLIMVVMVVVMMVVARVSIPIMWMHIRSLCLDNSIESIGSVSWGKKFKQGDLQ